MVCYSGGQIRKSQHLGEVLAGDQAEPEHREAGEPALQSALSPAAAAPAEAAGQAAEPPVPFTIFRPEKLDGHGLGAIFQCVCTGLNSGE